MKILMVLTSHDQLGNTGKKTGFWLEEFAAPYYVFKDAGATITLASPKGGQPPLDPGSDVPAFQTASTERFKKDAPSVAILAHTRRLSEVSPNDFDAVFYPGGHGPLWDLAEDAQSAHLIETMYTAGKLVGAVCHAPCALKNVKIAGKPIVEGKQVTCFSNTEEAAVKLEKVVPFLTEDVLKAQGGKYQKGPDWGPFVLVDGHLITGQNPASSAPVAQKMLEMLK
jgi:putative intracellular protease/amidase